MKLKSFYRRLFVSKKTVIISAILIFVLYAANWFVGFQTGSLDTFDYFDHIFRLLLTIFLLYAYLKHNLPSMQAGCCGLLICLIYYHANYVLVYLIGQGGSYFMGLGFWGAFFLACQVMVIVLEVFFLINHFALFVLKREKYLRVVVNQTLVNLIFFFLILLLFVILNLTTTNLITEYFILYVLSLAATFMLIESNELILVLDVEGAN